MTDIIIGAVLVIIVGLAVFYIIKEKKKGKRCIGCPDGGCDCCCSNPGKEKCNHKSSAE
ncbi:MAG: FeoB-associated Cys-rich membrane protein [Clostridia bacterium]|nr:FeoB-associated Cys-rich membrane protein [Clostridia bacterium]